LTTSAAKPVVDPAIRSNAPISPGGPGPSGPTPRHTFGPTFFLLNTIEMWERLAYYNVRVMAPIYIMQADEAGGLHLNAMDKGTIYAWWSAIQSILPIVTGGFADRWGYKKTLIGAITTMMIGYILLAVLRDVHGPLGYLNNYWGFFIGIMVLAAGTAFFKPGLQGSLAQSLNKENSSMGWGIFYWVVNVGSFVAHYLPGLMLTAGTMLPWILRAEAHSKEAWRNLFFASAFFTSFNLVLLCFLRDVPSGASKTDGVLTVLWRTISHIIEPRLLAFIIIMSGFWMMMYQLWDLQPNFIADWVDSGPLARRLTFLNKTVYDSITEVKPQGRMVAQQVLVSANSLCIIVGVMLASWVSRHTRTLSALVIGMLMATCGVLIAGWTMSVWVLLGGIVFFSLGEMFTGPKINAYLGLIAPPGKKGLYLGYSNIPAGLGVLIGAKLSGFVYGHYGEKAVLAQRYLAEKTPFAQGKEWNGDVTTLEATIGVSRPQAMAKLQEFTGMDAATATKVLWDTYDPQYHVWIPYACVGVVCAIALGIYGQMAKKWADMNA